MAAYHCFHAADAGRRFFPGNAQLEIGRILASGAMRAKIVGPPELNGTNHGENGFGAQLLVDRLPATRAGERPVIPIRRFELQQLRQSGGPGIVHGRADRAFDRFQIELTGCFAVPENDAEQLLYFAGDFLLDRFGRFFSCRV